MKIVLPLLASAHAYTELKDTMGPVGTRAYAAGVNPPAHQKTDPEKLVWAYVGPATQGSFGQVYHPHGAVTTEDLLNTPVNHLAFIANIDVTNKSTGWFAPGRNNTGGCGQYQTYELPFGYECKCGNKPAWQCAEDCDDSKSLPKFHDNLKKLKDSGVTLTLTLGSWCSELPVKEENKWTDEQFNSFVDYFEEIRETKFGGHLDGVDFDWEGYCSAGCLEGTCSCDWNDKVCGTKTPEELAAGVFWSTAPAPGQKPMKYQCWILPTQTTIQVMTGITHAMKKAGYVVTLVPMSTSMYSGSAALADKPTSRNEYVKWRKQTSLGKEVDLLDLADNVMLQWYSGFDAALCRHSDDPKTDCGCNNKPKKGYENIVNATESLLVAPWQTYWNVSGNSFPTTYPLRCQGCGDDVLRPDGTFGKFPCAPEEEQWYTPSTKRLEPAGANPPAVVKDHNAKLDAYVEKHHTAPHWWVKGKGVASKCPRSIDCPDWRYEGEEAYSRQVKLLKSLAGVVDLKKIAIGFETLGTDVLVQMQAWQDHALPWSTAPPKGHQYPMSYDNFTYYENCTQNMTAANYKEGKRCAAPIAWQQWGPKFDADDQVGLEKAVREQLQTEIAGIGLFTLDGVIAQKEGKRERLWHAELLKLNKTYSIPCKGSRC
jgi:hypothetical protein